MGLHKVSCYFFLTSSTLFKARSSIDILLSLSCIDWVFKCTTLCARLFISQPSLGGTSSKFFSNDWRGSVLLNLRYFLINSNSGVFSFLDTTFNSISSSCGILRGSAAAIVALAISDSILSFSRAYSCSVASLKAENTLIDHR